jgi:hypothetical protein
MNTRAFGRWQSGGRQSGRRQSGLGGLGLCLLAWLGTSPALAAPPAPGTAPVAARPAPAAHVSEASDRKAVSITVYNSDFGLVREVRDLKGLPSGQVALEFRDVASTIQPQTVAVKALGNAASFSVLEQNYRFRRRCSRSSWAATCGPTATTRPPVKKT